MLGRQQHVGGADTADELASAYRLSGLYGAGDKGAGQTVALVELELYSTSDIAAYQSCYGTNASVATRKRWTGGSGGGAGSGESALDIEDVIGLAPGVGIQGLRGPEERQHASRSSPPTTRSSTTTRPSVISTSWGICEPDLQSSVAASESTLFQEAAAQGQSMFAASGDAGSEDCDGDPSGGTQLAVDDPGSQPYVTSVGGTLDLGARPAALRNGRGTTCASNVAAAGAEAASRLSGRCRRGSPALPPR